MLLAGANRKAYKRVATARETLCTVAALGSALRQHKSDSAGRQCWKLQSLFLSPFRGSALHSASRNAHQSSMLALLYIDGAIKDAQEVGARKLTSRVGGLTSCHRVGINSHAAILCPKNAGGISTLHHICICGGTVYVVVQEVGTLSLNHGSRCEVGNSHIHWTASQCFNVGHQSCNQLQQADIRVYMQLHALKAGFVQNDFLQKCPGQPHLTKPPANGTACW